MIECLRAIALFLYQQELRVVQPVSTLRHQTAWQRDTNSKLHRLKDSELLVYTYSSTHSDSPAFKYVNSILRRLQEDPHIERVAANHPDTSDVSPYHAGRRLATQSAVFNGCIGWTNAPYGKMNSCPSVTQQLSMGVAHDTGYTKALTGYGTTSISEADAVDMVTEDAIMNNNILNVLMGQ